MAGNQGSQRAGLSLYANLLDNDTSATISNAPVTYGKDGGDSQQQDEAARKQQALAASIRFQPTKRPQLAAQKAKAKAIASKLSGIATPATEPKVLAETSAQNQSKTTAADWAATVSEDEDVNAYYAGTRTRGKKRKKKGKAQTEAVQDWDDIYDPSRPNNYEHYKHSEEKIREVREWKDLLYRHRIRSRSHSSESERSVNRPMNSENIFDENGLVTDLKEQFAPPPMSFAPPPIDNEEEYVPPPPPPTELPKDMSGDDAYLRRLKLGHTQLSEDPPPPPPDSAVGQISRAPVRYNFPPPPVELQQSEADLESKLEAEISEEQESQRSNRPGQKGFAERLLSKYGWTKGSGLGAQGQGIINPLYAKADKRKKKSDAEGGGYATPAGTGKILGGNKSKEAQKEETGKFGAMSEVIRLDGMLTGMNVQEELSKTDEENGGLMQEIGEECGEKYGSVERVFIHISEETGDAIVFVRFVSQLSALRAVNALEGRIFSGNTIKARFWDREKFDNEEYV